MTDTNNLSDPHPHLTDTEREIVQYFVSGQKHSLVSNNLKLEYTETSIRLSIDATNSHDRNGSKLLGISKQVNQWQRKVLISNDSIYRASVIDALSAYGFINKEKSSHPEFTEHHYYTFPEGYRLNYTEAIQLWRIWWNHKRYQLNMTGSPIDALIFSKGNWQVLRDLQPKQGNFILDLTRGKITVEPEEYLVWIDRPDPELINSSSPTSVDRLKNALPDERARQAGERRALEVTSTHPLDRRSLIKIGTEPLVDRADKDSPTIEAEIDLESYLNTFNTEDTEDVDRIEGIYNIDELLSRSNISTVDEVLPNLGSAVASSITSDIVGTSTNPAPLPTVPESLAPDVEPTPVEQPATEPVTNPPTSPTLSLSQRQELLKRKAMTVLARYLKEGDRMVRTEVLKNAQGQEINRKIVKTQRGCPQWAIEQILKLS